MSADLDVRKTALLARVQLSEEEVAKFQAQLSQVLEHVAKLNQVDVSGVEPTAHANAVFNVFRADEERPGLPAAETLANAPRTVNQLYMVPKVIE
jgi:aspartyl-tRNA(Asn)/glutamyl-tRNA(Gln) amidotransferase subunit C